MTRSVTRMWLSNGRTAREIATVCRRGTFLWWAKIEGSTSIASGGGVMGLVIERIALFCKNNSPGL